MLTMCDLITGDQFLQQLKLSSTFLSDRGITRAVALVKMGTRLLLAATKIVSSQIPRAVALVQMRIRKQPFFYASVLAYEKCSNFSVFHNQKRKCSAIILRKFLEMMKNRTTESICMKEI